MWSGVSLSELLRDIIRLFQADLVVLEGDDIPLSDRALPPLAFVFYELCTNSVKYGALGQKDGTLQATSKIDGPRFEITWQAGGSFGATPSEGEAGFGSLMCERMLAVLRGTFHREVTPEQMTAWTHVLLSAAQED